MITPYRKNQLNKLTTYDKIKLSKRHIVENTFSWFKKFKRLILRYDRKIENFKSFVYIGASIIISKKVDHLQ